MAAGAGAAVFMFHTLVAVIEGDMWDLPTAFLQTLTARSANRNIAGFTLVCGCNRGFDGL